jgi:hypothetical protein
MIKCFLKTFKELFCSLNTFFFILIRAYLGKEDIGVELLAKDKNFTVFSCLPTDPLQNMIFQL